MAAPIFPNEPYAGTIPENAVANTPIGPVTATDADNDPIAYEITGGDDVTFKLDSATGVLSTDAPLDFETSQVAVLEITATAIDGSDITTFDIEVEDVNETPSLTVSDPLETPENHGVGTLIGTVSAIDPENDQITYGLAPTDAPFKVDAVTGAITTTASLDRETESSYALTFTANDGLNTAELEAVVEVTDENEAPVPGKAVAGSLPENAAIGAKVGTAAATDPEKAQITYTLATPNVPFDVDPDTGEITTTGALDREARASYELSIDASDGTNTTELTATVAVTDVNEAPTAVLTGPFNLDETTQGGVAVGKVTAADPEGQRVGYTLATPNVPFRVNAVTGQITTTAPLDHEARDAYLFTVNATDGRLVTPLTVAVGVNDVDEAPVAGKVAPISVPEGTVSGTKVGQVTATDPEETDVAYSVSSKTASGVPFAVDPVSGEITVDGALNFEQAGAYTLFVDATDDDGLGKTTTINVPITVADVDEAPVVTANPLLEVIDENTAAGVAVGTVAAVDPDGTAVTYTLASQGVPFAANAATGAVTTTAALDHEAEDTYLLTVDAKDGTGKSTPATFTVLVDDLPEAPVFDSDGPFSVAENLDAGEVVGQVAATDPDGDVAVGYTLATGGAPFALDAVTGEITTTEELDREAQASYTLAVVATDGESDTEISVTVDVEDEDEAPVAGAPVSGALPESVAAGTTVGTLMATDPEGEALTYALTGTGNGPFAVNPATGAITTTAALDFEGRASYTLNVSASDGANTVPLSAAFTVTDVDEPPVADGPTAPLSVAENLAAGEEVGTVAATDPEGEDVTYTLATEGAPFAVDKATGAITTTKELDREAEDSYTLEIVATDGALETEISVAVDVEDENEAPVAAPPASPFTVGENLAVGGAVGRVRATDPEGGTVTYELRNPGASPFAVNAATGAITTTAALDRETKPAYALTVDARDAAGSATPINVAVELYDVNEAPVPTGPAPSFEVAENRPAGAAVGTVAATDPEAVSVTYTLATQNVPFAVNGATGAITTTAPLDFEARPSYALTVNARDPAGNTAPINVTVGVADANEPPVADPAGTAFSFNENTAPGTAIGTLRASDPEARPLTFGLANAGEVPFGVNAATGEVAVTDRLDFEAAGSRTYQLQATASDGTSTTAFTVAATLRDVDEAPVASGGPPRVTVAENAPAGTRVGTFAATDPERGTLTYALTGAGNGPFKVDPATGAITTTEAIDFERLQSAAFEVAATVSDGANSTALSATVTVTDVDEAPVATPPAGPFAAVEGQKAGTAVGTVRAADPEGKALTYAITAGNTDGAFALATTGTGADRAGAITTTGAFGYGDATSRALTVTASDGANAVAIPVAVNIEQVPAAPVFTAASVREDAAVGATLGRFSVPDAGGRTASFAGPSGAAYAVAADGTVTLKAPLDFEAADTLAVSATAAFAGASQGVRSPEGSGTVALGDVYEPGTPGQSAPPAPIVLSNGAATVAGTATGFKAVDGEFAFTDENGAVAVVPGVERAVFADGALSFAADTPEAFLHRLYLGLFGREADGRGIAYQADALEAGATLGQVAQGFVDSAEYAGNADGPLSDRDFVEALYVNFLGREADEGGAAAWTDLLATGAVTRGDVAAGFADSAEAQAKYEEATARGVWVADLEDLTLDSLFVAGLGREADAGARAAFAPALDAGTLTREGLAQAVAASPEFATRHGSDAEGAVEMLFQDALGREADPAGLAAFVAVYNTQGAAAALLGITASAEFAAVEEYRASGEYLFD